MSSAYDNKGYGYNEQQDIFKAPRKQEVTTTWIEVESLNGKEFTSSSGKIDIYLPPNIKYFDPSQSYLSFDLELENQDGTALNLLRQGASCLFRSIRIYSAGASAKLLEEIDNYNVYVDVLYQYTLSMIGDKDKKSMTELVQTWDNANNPYNENVYTPFQNPYNSGTTGTITTAKTSVKQRIQLPLHSGLFKKSEVFANALLGGIRIELQLRTDKEVLKTTNANGLDEDSSLNIEQIKRYYADVDGTLNAGLVLSGSDQLDIENGQKGISVSYGFKCLPWSVGQELKIYQNTNPANSDKLGKLVDVEVHGGEFRIRVDGVGTLAHTYGGVGCIGPDVDNITATYKISNLSMVVCEISPSSEWENQLINMASSNQGWNYDLITATNYLSSQVAGNSAIVSHIPVVNTRIKSIWSVPVRVQTATYFNNNQTGNYDRYTDYQYFYLNQNQPNQLVPLDRVANKLPESIHLDQITKAIDGAEYPVNNLRHFENCFWVGRGVSYGRGSLNLDAKDLMLKINTTSSGLQYNTLFNHYVISLRRLRVSNGDLEVFY